MSSLEPVVCYRCGSPISSYKESYDYILSLKNNISNKDVNIYNEIMNSERCINMQEVNKILGLPNNINKYCCVMQLMTTVTIKDLRNY